MFADITPESVFSTVFGYGLQIAYSHIAVRRCRVKVKLKLHKLKLYIPDLDQYASKFSC